MRVSTYLVIVMTLIGIISSGICSVLLIHLTKESKNITKTTNGLLKQIRLRFENCYRLDLQIRDVRGFVEKYIDNYKYLGLPMIAYKSVSNLMALGCVFVGTAEGIRGIIKQLEYKEYITYIIIYVLAAIMVIVTSQVWALEYKKEHLIVNISEYLENTLANRLSASDRKHRRENERHYERENNKKNVIEKDYHGEAVYTDDVEMKQVLPNLSANNMDNPDKKTINKDDFENKISEQYADELFEQVLKEILS